MAVCDDREDINSISLTGKASFFLLFVVTQPDCVLSTGASSPLQKTERVVAHAGQL
jgi:hypothetical protein